MIESPISVHDQRPTKIHNGVSDIARWYTLAERCARDAIANGLDDPRVQLRRVDIRLGTSQGIAVSAGIAFTERVDAIAARLRLTLETELELRATVRSRNRDVLCRVLFRVHVQLGRAVGSNAARI